MTDPDHDVQQYKAKIIEATDTISRLRGRLHEAERCLREPIAVAGAGLRMPGGARTPTQFWSLLRRGVDMTGDFPSSRADARSLLDPDPDHPGTAYVTRGAFLDEVDGFDPGVFGISPREAVGMDPQQRIILELGWEALERAGYAPTDLVGHRTGVYVGVSTTDYVRMRQQLGDPRDVDAYQLIGEPSFIAGRLSYTLGLRGPSMVIDTTCSSALVAVHEACQGLRAGECDMALAGGVNLMLSPYGFLLMSKFRALAPDGRCKTFDASADGYARGEGAGLIVLKRLSDAVADSDTVLAVIVGSAVNHDGRSSGLTVPSPDAQQDVIRRALGQAGVDHREISYVEAHGTGTSLGDPIELGALDAVLGEGRDPAHPVLVGSVKTNVGHLEPAAGIAGLLKVILAMLHSEIPPHLNLATPNPKIPWRRLRIDVPTSVVPWPRHGRPRLAAVSSFGASGTNAHLIVRESPQEPVDGDIDGDGDERSHLLLISARTGAALRQLASDYVGHLDAGEHRLADVCFTSQVGRARHPCGLAVTGRTSKEIAGQLRSFAGGRPPTQAVEAGLAPHKARKMGWLLTGQGAQYPGMAAGLRDEPAFAEPLRECLELLDPQLPRPLEQVLWGDPADRTLDDTRYTQPALFAIEYALGRALLTWGLRPSAMLGHSVGEITAACLAGAVDLSDAARLVAQRARLMAELPPVGVMAAINCDEATAREAIAERADRLAVAAVNGPTEVVLSGADDDMRAVVGPLAEAGRRVRFLTVSHAFHSPLLEPMLGQFRELLDTINVRVPEIPLISNVTGQFWTSDELDRGYWARQAIGTVRFHDGVRRLHEDGIHQFVEVGPHPVLTGLGPTAIDDPSCIWVGLLRRGADDLAQLLSALGVLHLRGSSLNWEGLHGHRPVRRVPGPTYPWQHKRYWFRPAAAPSSSAESLDGLGTRVRNPDPLFEQQIDEGPASGTDVLAELVERSLRAARVGLGGRWCDLSQAIAEPEAVHLTRGPWLVQTAVRQISDEAADVVSSVAHTDAARAGAPWHPGGRITVRRAAGQGPAPLSRSDGPEPMPEPSPATTHAHRTVVEHKAESLSDDAAAWAAIARAASAAVGAAADRPGWASSFTEATCEAPSAVRDVRIAGTYADADGFAADITLCGDGGQPLGQIHRLRWRPTPEAPRSRWEPEDELVYRIAWAPAELQQQPPRDQVHRVILIGAGETCTDLTDELRRQNVTCTKVAANGGMMSAEIDGLLAERPTRIVVSGLDLPEAGSLTIAALADELLTLEQLIVRVTQRIAARPWPDEPPRLVLMTRGAVAAEETQRGHNPAAATLWGLGRTVALEHPDCWGAAVDLDPDGGGTDPATLADAVLTATAEDQCAFRGQRRLVPRLRPISREAVPLPSARRPHRPGTVLITGGWGGIGTAAADWLARTGTEQIVLAGRTALPAEATWDDPALPGDMRTRIATVRRLRKMGVHVVHAQLDVTDHAAVRELVTRLAADPLPLRGVLHAAGLSAPQDIAEIDPASYQKVWAPKTIGAWLLHEATRSLDLDFFVCFSSIAATWGSQHLAGYSAANMFLDGLAQYRHSLGLPCLTVDWGPWGGASHLFGDDVGAFLESLGLRWLNPDQCLSLLARLIRGGQPQYVVCAVDWARYKPVMEVRSARPVFNEIAVPAEEEETEKDRKLLERLTAHAGDSRDARSARLELLGGFLSSAVAEVLRTDTRSVPADADVFALGLDSLMVMEVATKCRRRLGVTLPPSDFFARSTLADWAAHLDQVIDGDAPAQNAAEAVRQGHRAGAVPAVDHYESAAAIADRTRLAPDVQHDGIPPRAGAEVVLVTGATGFVGAFILDELLARTTAEVVCLVRGADSEHGRMRIRRAVEKYLPWREAEEGRLKVLAGDLASPHLGLAEEDYASLAEHVGAIYHAGAWVDFVHTFDQLADTNIAGTEEILRLAGRGRSKLVNHLSTYGIWGLPVPGRSRIVETEDISTAGRLVTGYVQTKWGAEHMVAQARGRGIAVRTFRLGRVLGDSRSGRCLTTHFTCRVIKGCIQLGLAPDLGELEIEMTPVDYVTRALVHISHADTADAVFHLINPHRMPFLRLVDFIQRKGWDVKVVDRQKWWTVLQRSVGVDPNDLHPVMDTVREFVVGGEQAIDYDTTCTQKALMGSGISCPPLDEKLLETYFGYFRRSGYLPR